MWWRPACQTRSKVLDISSATAGVSPELLKALAIPLETTVRWSCINSSQSSATVSSVPSVCLTTSVHNNVTKKPITCRDSVIKRPRKCLCKSTIAKNCNAVNYDSESVNNAVNCSCSFSTSSSDFVSQPVRFNKSVYKHISSSVVNKPTPSVDASETFCPIVKCKNKFYDVKITFMMYGHSF